MAGKLKVFRTAAGFHDAYIAAPSQKAALKAWGAHGNLFAQGLAEQVTDPDLTKAALEHPGEIIKLPRENTDEPPATNAGKTHRAKPTAEVAPKPAPRPRPSRSKLDAAEHAEEQQQRELAAQIEDLESQRRTLAARITEIKASGATAHAKLAKRVARQKEAHESALENWRRDL